MQPMNMGNSQHMSMGGQTPTAPTGEGSKKTLIWGIVALVVIVGGFMLFSGRSADEAVVEDVVEDSGGAAGTVPAGINAVVVSRSADLSARATIKAGDDVIEEFSVTLTEYSDITPVLEYVVEIYGADNPTLTYESVLDMVVFEDVSRPAETE